MTTSRDDLTIDEPLRDPATHANRKADRDPSEPKAIPRLALCKGGAGLLYALAKKTRSLIAQLVEQSTVNRSVAGSSPAQGAKSHF